MTFMGNPEEEPIRQYVRRLEGIARDAGYIVGENFEHLNPEPIQSVFRKDYIREDYREWLKQRATNEPGTVTSRFYRLLYDLEMRFPDPTPFIAEPSEIRYMAAIDALRRLHDK